MVTMLWNMADDGDVCSVVLLIAILAAIGQRMAESSDVAVRWGRRLTVAAFLAYVVREGVLQEPIGAPDWLQVVLRGLLAGGLAWGLSLIGLSILVFLSQSAVALATALRCRRAARRLPRQVSGIPLESPDETQRRAQEDLRRQADELQKAGTRLEAQRRRTDARASVELEYARLSSSLGNFFTREMLTAYRDTYMSDAHSPEDVERRGQDLIGTLQTHIADQESRKQPISFEQLAAWYQTEKERIESSSADDRLKRRLLASLNVRHAELATNLMENRQP